MLVPGQMLLFCPTSCPRVSQTSHLILSSFEREPKQRLRTYTRSIARSMYVPNNITQNRTPVRQPQFRCSYSSARKMLLRIAAGELFHGHPRCASVLTCDVGFESADVAVPVLASADRYRAVRVHRAAVSRYHSSSESCIKLGSLINSLITFVAGEEGPGDLSSTPGGARQPVSFEPMGKRISSCMQSVLKAYAKRLTGVATTQSETKLVLGGFWSPRWAAGGCCAILRVPWRSAVCVLVGMHGSRASCLPLMTFSRFLVLLIAT